MKNGGTTSCAAIVSPVHQQSAFIQSSSNNRERTWLSAAYGGEHKEQQEQQQRLGQLAHDLPHHDAHRLNPPFGRRRMNLPANPRVIQFKYWHIASIHLA